jgi:hypothetical protein
MILFENYRSKVPENFTFTYFWRARNFKQFIASKNITSTKWGDYAFREMRHNISIYLHLKPNPRTVIFNEMHVWRRKYLSYNFLKLFQQDDTFLYSILFPVNGSTCFGLNIHPSCEWVGRTHPRRRKVTDYLPLPDAVTTVYSSSWWWGNVSPETRRKVYRE